MHLVMVQKVIHFPVHDVWSNNHGTRKLLFDFIFPDCLGLSKPGSRVLVCLCTGYMYKMLDILFPCDTCNKLSSSNINVVKAVIYDRRWERFCFVLFPHQVNYNVSACNGLPNTVFVFQAKVRRDQTAKILGSAQVSPAHIISVGCDYHIVPLLSKLLDDISSKKTSSAKNRNVLPSCTRSASRASNLPILEVESINERCITHRHALCGLSKRPHLPRNPLPN
mmetsp:Transcript_8556/g.13887  ORF Transcript_8556/g.13887 Transcript_8556/m.13887 type:complete len:223 (+) Transcript_8556:498-1166(+)